MNWETRIETYTLLTLYIKQTNNENLLYNAGYSTVLCGDLNEKEIQKTGIYVYIQLIHFAVQQKLTQQCKGARCQQKVIKQFLYVLLGLNASFLENANSSNPCCRVVGRQQWKENGAPGEDTT